MREGIGEETMALVTTKENLPLVEPVPIEDELCSGLALIEDVAGIAARFVLYHTQTLYEVGTTVFVVKKKIIMPYAAIPFGVKMTAEFMARRAGGGRMLQLVPPR
jgi:hypothetical protein